MKKLLLLLSVCYATGECSEPHPPQESRQLVTTVFEAFNQHKGKEMASYYTDNALLEDPSFSGSLMGSAGMEKRFNALQAAYPDIQDQIKHIFASGNTVTVGFVARGTAADNSHSFYLPITSIFTIGGKIMLDATYYNLQN